mgnify:CR=1 FL=1
MLFRSPKYSFRLFSNADKGIDDHADPRYISDEIWFDRIIPCYNNLIFAKAMQDKCLHNLLFPEARRPVTVVKRIAGVFYDDDLNLLTREEASAKVKGHGRVIVKPSVSTGKGEGILFFDSDDISLSDTEAVFDRFGDNFIIQEKMTQHDALAALNPSSINTVRILTFLHDDEVRVLSACLRIGGSASEVDNVSQGGWCFTITREGRIAYRGYSHAGGVWRYSDTLPTGETASGYIVPGYQKAEELVCRLASRMSHFRSEGRQV